MKMKKIKLVVWDLDETFWKGTLSEEGVVPIEEHIKIIKELTNRGIINSIVSKNDFEQAKQKLIELGVWEYFVFPFIEWSPKGPLIKELIERCQLRATNVLFLDDNHLNLEEAKYYNPELNVADENFIPEILTHEAFLGKNDQEHSRLKQYKILEEKFDYSKNYNDNISFLKDSNIKVSFLRDKELLENVDRVAELIERTNQLNYTKLRIDKDEVEALLKDKVYESVAVRVSDRFGDYGIVGFCSYHQAAHQLKHFVFSCRILNLGVEQYLYAKYGFPKIDIVPEVAVALGQSTPDWITEEQREHTSQENKTNQPNEKENVIFFKGGCDLSQMLFYLNNNGFSVVEETNYTSQKNVPIHQEHTQIVIDSLSISDQDRAFLEQSEYIPFVDEKFYETKMFEPQYKAVVYSLLMDYTNELYQSKNREVVLPYGGYYNLWTEEANDEELYRLYKSRNISIPQDTFSHFRKEFKHIGKITPAQFKANLAKIRALIPKEIPLILLNGVELESPNTLEKEAYARHIEMNKALEEFIESAEHVYLLDVRKIVNKQELLKDNLRHYNRESYQKLSMELLKLLNQHTTVEAKEEISKKVIFKSKIKAYLLNNKLFMKVYRKLKSFR